MAIRPALQVCDFHSSLKLHGTAKAPKYLDLRVDFNCYSVNIKKIFGFRLATSTVAGNFDQTKNFQFDYGYAAFKHKTNQPRTNNMPEPDPLSRNEPDHHL